MIYTMKSPRMAAARMPRSWKNMKNASVKITDCRMFVNSAIKALPCLDRTDCTAFRYVSSKILRAEPNLVVGTFFSNISACSDLAG